jgi:hypothetical protein
MNNLVFAHLPYRSLGQYLEYILERRINPELFFNGDTLDAASGSSAMHHTRPIHGLKPWIA